MQRAWNGSSARKATILTQTNWFEVFENNWIRIIALEIGEK